MSCPPLTLYHKKKLSLPTYATGVLEFRTRLYDQREVHLSLLGNTGEGEYCIFIFAVYRTSDDPWLRTTEANCRTKGIRRRN